MKPYFANSKATVKKKMYKRSVINMLRKEIKWNHRKCSIKTQEGKEETNETNNK